MDHMMVNYDIATVKEFMFCTWPQLRMERLFLQLIKKKLTSLDKCPPLNCHKTLISPFLFPPLKFQKKFSPTNQIFSVFCKVVNKYWYLLPSTPKLHNLWLYGKIIGTSNRNYLWKYKIFMRSLRNINTRQ